ncbi:NAD(P)H-dependent oxidoreductase [Saccharicrinis sp. FJH54]|uniref:NAD(P)H-dependent oxidoreductase n=1 Tax=Saccharicrinis sp. FJH54 TaxID=3344665 RepID=UPI0035D458A2
MDLIEKLNWRYAVKKMSGENPDETRIRTLLEAVRLSASSYGFQPYKLIVVKDLELMTRLKAASYDQEKVTEASHILVFATKTNLGENEVEKFIQLNAEIRNEPEKSFERLRRNIIRKLDKNKRQGTLDCWTANQAYIALGNVLTSAAVLGIDACPMEGFKADQYDEILGLGELNLTAAVVCALGVRSDEDEHQMKEKVRWKPEDFFVTM